MKWLGRGSVVPIGYGEPTGGRVASVSNQRLFAEAAWIDHSLGVVLAQRVSFDERPRNGTRVHTWGDIVHTALKIAGRTVEPVVTSFTETGYENFRCACDHLAEASGD
jgi:hypothetical protein